MKGMKVLRTKKRTVVTEVNPIKYNRPVYRNEAGEWVKPLNQTSGLELCI